jgi:putative transcriptional regulator
MKKTAKKMRKSRPEGRKLERSFMSKSSLYSPKPKESALRRARVTAGGEGGDDLTSVLLETAESMYKTGIMDKAGFEKITMRHLKKNRRVLIISGVQIRKLRESANMSQSVFADILNLTPGYISAMERGEKKPSGSTLAMLDLIKRKGISSVLD